MLLIRYLEKKFIAKNLFRNNDVGFETFLVSMNLHYLLLL